MGLRADILELLADGSAHSGEALAERLGSSRTAVWKHVQHLAARGIAIEARRGIGYRIPGGLDLLDAAALSAALPAKARPLLAGLELVAETASTNERLLAAAERGDIHCRCLLAEYQSEGRGRRGRQWRCPYGAGVLLSLGWRFERGAEALAGLSLAAGVAVRDALAAAGIPGVGLKWPNDLYAGGRKLGGILVELRGEVAGGMTAVLGLGLNVSAAPADEEALRMPAACLETVAGRRVPRNPLAAQIIGRLLLVLDEFARAGFEALRERWLAHDVGLGREVAVDLGTSTVRGRMLGVDRDGALLLDSGGRVRRFVAGDVTLSV